jgi:transposase
MKEVSTIGLDLAKNVFQVHGVDGSGETVIRRQLRRGQVLPFFKRLPPCLVGIEACATSNYWAREITALGHEVRMMPARYVKPYVKRNKNDAADAEAICEADRRILTWHRASELSRRLDDIPGVGPLIATASVASIPDPQAFKSGRDMSAWIGLVPKQNSTGGKERLGHISKAGNRYLRKLLVVGALSVIRRAKQTGASRHPWLVALMARRSTKVAAIALANKIARIAWAMMVRGTRYQEPLPQAA